MKGRIVPAKVSNTLMELYLVKLRDAREEVQLLKEGSGSSGEDGGTGSDADKASLAANVTRKEQDLGRLEAKVVAIHHLYTTYTPPIHPYTLLYTPLCR